MSERDRQIGIRGRRGGHLPGRLISIKEYERRRGEISADRPVSPISVADTSFNTFKRWYIQRLSSSTPDSEFEGLDKSKILRQFEKAASSYEEIFKTFRAKDLDHQDVDINALVEAYDSDLFGITTKIMRSELVRIAKTRAKLS
ncbi:MAG: hypothetical protein A2798_03220 [Candidatus Levybacteria bacterium RIFCSPHIGHO2_01_FULL_37_17]|nr:MAG: hypothetical protein A2798_03220 [Candidatus Levybacteria bacterium RIFCSPHIGHO2_01_FULL_37_17]OGH36865.1 MAG: hypothetical protein A2959_01210 [Candidatus Levybacteria bacterium RIFCSPLOWO2_01_FULL_38_23]